LPEEIVMILTVSAECHKNKLSRY